ncbi:MAG: BON domain-containing protein [Thiobacillus sp.]|nr:BON domain-containing protein [Thiobacillus sp.]
MNANTSKFLAAVMLGGSLLASGCAVTREQSTVGQYVDDSAITTKVKAKFAESPVVSAMAINVETLNGTVQLSGFAKNASERSTAESIARSVQHVKAVKNDIVIKP